MVKPIVKSAKQARQEGEANELRVIDFLRTSGLHVRKSLDYEDKYQDIDVHVQDEQNPKLWIPYSIKVNSPEFYEKPFIFELYEGWLRREVEDDDPEYMKWWHRYTLDNVEWWVHPQRSWYYNGRSKYYLVWKRKTIDSGVLWKIDKQKLTDYVDEHGFDNVISTSKEIAKRERVSGKVYTKIGILDQRQAQASGIATIHSFINMEETT